LNKNNIMVKDCKCKKNFKLGCKEQYPTWSYHMDNIYKCYFMPDNEFAVKDEGGYPKIFNKESFDNLFEIVEIVKLKEHDVVVTKIELSEIPIGTHGTIIHEYPNENYVVEFIKMDGEASILETLSLDQIEKK